MKNYLNRGYNMRETIDISRIKQQEDICAEIFETVTG